MDYELTEEETSTEVRISTEEYEKMHRYEEIEKIYHNTLEEVFEILNNIQDYDADIYEAKKKIKDCTIQVAEEKN